MIAYSPNPMLPFDRCLMREHVMSEMARARFCKREALPFTVDAVRSARKWNQALVRALQWHRARASR